VKGSILKSLRNHFNTCLSLVVDNDDSVIATYSCIDRDRFLEVSVEASGFLTLHVRNAETMCLVMVVGHVFPSGRLLQHTESEIWSWMGVKNPLPVAPK